MSGAKTKAAILVKLKQPLEIGEIELTKLQRGQVLVKMLAAGVCRSQLSEINGDRGPDRYLPHLLGHEGAGAVEAVGEGVKTVRPGDRVVVSWIKGKGLDVPGGVYKWGRRRVNAGGAAVFTERAIVSENRVTKIPKTVLPQVAAVIGCAVATGAGAVRHVLQVSKGQSLAVFGVGGVGASAVMAAAAAGCREIIAVDLTDKKLKWANSLGATQMINARRDDPVALILKKFAGGVDNALEATGVAKIGEQAFAVLNRAGKLVVAGHPQEGERMCVEPFKLIEGRKIMGTWGGGTKPEQDFTYYARMWRIGKMPIDRLVTHRYSLEDINRALAVLEKGNAGRVIIEFSR